MIQQKQQCKPSWTVDFKTISDEMICMHTFWTQNATHNRGHNIMKYFKILV